MTLASLALLAGLAAAPAPSLEVRFIGNMGFALSDGGTTLVTDFPYQSGAFGYQSWKAEDLPPFPGEVTVLFTHRHDDHFDKALLEARGWKAFGPDDLLALVPAARRADPKSLETKGIVIRALPTPHAEIGHYSYLIEWKGLRIYHSGDTEDPASLLSAGDLDLALISPWMEEAARKKGWKGARRILVCHSEAEGELRQLTGGAVRPAQGERVTVPFPAPR
jgi:L-ascorbate metabolism protein UlaG (beta-lactamase superfamily)